MTRSPFAVAALVTLAAVPACAQGAHRVRHADESCVIATVIDGDTFGCRGGARVRLIGIDAPERSQGGAYQASREALRRIAGPGDTVRLERDVTPRDRFGRELAWAWHDSTLVSEAMVAQGYALLFTVPPNVKYVERIAEAQRRARAAGAGLWATNGFDCAPSDRRRGRC
jgi:micrococcal nuclease